MRQLREQLRNLTAAVLQFENELDRLMKLPDSYQRGKSIGEAVNRLTLANQEAMRYGLGYSFPKIERLYEKGAP